MRLGIVVLIAVLFVGGSVISLGLLASSEHLDVPEISNQYEKLEMYKNKLEKINQHNQRILLNLEEQINNSGDIPLGEIYEEIETVKLVIDENKAELEKVIIKLSQMESNP